MGRRSTRWSDTNVKSGCRLVPPTRTASTESVSAHLEVLEATRQAFAQRQIEFFGDTQRRRRGTNVDERQLELFTLANVRPGVGRLASSAHVPAARGHGARTASSLATSMNRRNDSERCAMLG